MKILISANTFWNLFNFRLKLIESFISQNYEVIALAKNDIYKEKLLNLGIKCYNIDIELKGVNPLSDLVLIKDYFKIFKKTSPDVILSYTVKPNIYGNLAAQLLKIKTINNVSGLGTLFINKNFASFIGKILYKISFKFSAHIFFQNLYDQKLFLNQSLIKGSSNSIIPGSGLDTNEFKFNRLKNNCESFLFVGRIIGDKGIMEYLKSAKIILKKHPNKKFYIAGDINYQNRSSISKKDFNKFLKNHPQISFLGNISDMFSLLKTVDVFVLPSYREGLSRAILEASSMSLPVITTNVPGCKDIVIDDYSGLLCDPKSVKSLSSAIEKIINLSESKRIFFGKNGRKIVKKSFGIDKIISIYNQKIKELVN